MSIEAREEDIVSFIEGIKRQWVAMIDTIADPILLIDIEGRIVKTNRAMADVLSLKYEEIIGKPSDDLFAQIKLPTPLTLVKQASNKSKNKQMVNISTEDDNHYEISVQNFLDENGKHEGYVLLFNDISDSKKLQSQLVQSEKLASIGLLAGGIAHEINNPLGGILVFSQMILREMSANDKHYSDVEEILNATERCKAIVENLLEFARQSPSRVDKVAEKIDIIAAIETALRFVRLGMTDKNINVIWEKEQDVEGKLKVACVVGDKNKMIQLFLNLMQNGVQAMPNGGELTLKFAIENDSQLICQVQDTGTGISQKAQKKVFDPFFTTKDPGEGTGLGLAICYGIIEEMGGKISLKSKENEGSTFTVSFPLHKNEDKKTA